MKKFDQSIDAYKEAVDLMPGGVNSPVRAFKSVGMSPIFMESGKGSKITDIDGNEYIDYVLSWCPLLLGHAEDNVVKKLQDATARGTSFGAATTLENDLANMVIDRVPSVEMLRMVKSGNEATMSALRVARGYTGRSKILKFEWYCNGQGDSLLILDGSYIATLGHPYITCILTT